MELDDDGYPTSETLQTIKSWPIGSYNTMMENIKDIWRNADYGYWKVDEEGKYHISTSGWSGNEEIIGALRANLVFWGVCWEQSRRGGHYIFDLSRGKIT